MTHEREHTYRHPWLGVEVRHLATLVAVARTGSFRQAAAELGYAQSAVSQNVSSLEAVVGAQLVQRHKGQRTVSLTPAGERLVERSLEIIGQLRAARLDVATTGADVSRSVVLAVASAVAPSVLARLVPALRESLPGLCLRVTETADDEDLVACLEDGGADLGIGAPASTAGLAALTVTSDPYVLLVPADSPLAGPRRFATAELAAHRLIVPASALSDAGLRGAGLRLDRAIGVPYAAAIPRLVADGLGIGLIPDSEAVDVPSRLLVLSTAGLIAPRRLALCWHPRRMRTALIESFAAVAVRALEHRDARDDRPAFVRAA